MIINDPDFRRIAEYALGMAMLSPNLRVKYRKEYNEVKTFDELSEGAQYVWRVAKAKIDAREEPIPLDEAFENANWLTPTPESVGIRSKAGLETYLKEHDLTLDELRKTALYRMNKEAFGQLGV